MATILTKKKDTTGAPSAGDLTNSTGGAELAVNTADKRLYTKDSGGNVVEVGINPTSITTGTLNTSGAVVFNDAGADVDFRVEGDTDANLLFVDASADRVGVGTNTPQNKLSILGATQYLSIVNTTAGGVGTESFGGIKFFGFNESSVIGQIDCGNSAAADFAGTLRFSTSTSGGTFAERMRIDSGGNVGIGVTPSAWNSTYRALDIGNGFGMIGSAGAADLYFNAFLNSGGSFIYKTNASASGYSLASGQHRWYTAPSGTAGNAITFTQAMTLDASGNLLVGTTSVDSGAKLTINHAGQVGAVFAITATTSSGMIYFRNGNGVVGQISTNGSATSYLTSSDYRLKENVAPMTGALAKILELNPVTYTWKADGSAGEGFLAHELQAVCPEAVTGEKDATEIQQVEVSPAIPATYDEEGNELTPAVEAVYEEREVPVYQGVDTSFLVATLTAAIQELSAKNDALEARIAALENA